MSTLKQCDRCGDISDVDSKYAAKTVQLYNPNPGKILWTSEICSGCVTHIMAFLQRPDPQAEATT
jgi:ribosomal protein S27AE